MERSSDDFYISEKQHSYCESLKAAEWSFGAVVILFLLGMLFVFLGWQ